MDINIRETAALAKLDFSEQDAQRIKADMQAIMDDFSVVAQIESCGEADLLPICTMREDIPEVCPDTEQIIRSAPCIQDGYIAVPQVVGGEEE